MSAPTVPSQAGRQRRSLLGHLVGQVLVALLRFYQRWISPLSPPTCRYYPSCSAYAVTAISRHGPVRGGWLAVKRLGRCHPWTPGGVDEVPPVHDMPADAGEHRHPTCSTAAAERVASSSKRGTS